MRQHAVLGLQRAPNSMRLVDVIGQQCRGKWLQYDAEQKEQVHDEENMIIRALDVIEHIVMRGPRDSDEDER